MSEGGSGAAAGGWSVLVGRLIGGKNLLSKSQVALILIENEPK